MTVEISTHALDRWRQRFPNAGPSEAALREAFGRSVVIPEAIARFVFSKGRGPRRCSGRFDPLTGAAFVVGGTEDAPAIVTVIKLRSGAETLVRRCL